MIDKATALQRKARRRRLVAFGAMAAVGSLFAAIIGNAFAATTEQRQAEHWRVHTLKALLVVSNTETAVNATLRGARGFLLTGDAHFLASYSRGRSESDSLLSVLRRLTRDNPVQRRNLADAAARLRAYLAAVDAEVALEQAGRRAEATALAVRGTDGARIDGVLEALRRTKDEEFRLLGQRSAREEVAARRAQGMNWLIAALGAAMMALLAAAMAGAARAHRRALTLTAALQRRATTDALTGLPNRRHMMAAIETEVRRARRGGRPVSLAILDIDHFKRINDAHGHPAGDAVLRAVAAVLRATTRAGDLPARIGGEEFAVLMPETDTAQAERACERLRAAIQERAIALPRGAVANVTVSTGVALLSEDEPRDQFISRADKALYEAKESGRNQVRLAA